MRWLGLAAESFVRAGEGVIVGVSSVAGDRGRRGNSAYMASKAGLSTYLESLRYRLRGTGVRVVTIKPGYVATPMTADLKLPQALTIPPERAAKRIAQAARKSSGVVYVPGYWAPIMWGIRQLPAAAMARLPI
jgi:decaprenylphospho-beta-D-erythro-pentofuranosid-2-ulose 2-reductase